MCKCNNNGRCCRELTDGTYQFETINGELIIMVVENGVCQYLDNETNECTIYDNRPLICKNYFCPYCKYK